MRDAAASAPPIDVGEQDLSSGQALARLLSEYAKHHPKAPAGDVAAIERAAAEASRAHAEQRRRSGEPYFVHPMRVAITITTLGLDAVSIVAGLLHDAVEDSELTVFDVHERFGREVASIVDGVTKLGKVPYLSRQEQQAESFRKMLLAMSEDIRVLIVKLIDRLDNMRTLGHMPAEKQERISRETMQIYAPLAGRLGIESIRGELQDLSFRYLEPSVYAATRADIDRFMRGKPGVVESTVEHLRAAFDPDFAASGDAEDDAEPLPRWLPDTLGPVSVRATLRPPFRVHRRLEPSGRRPDQLSDVATFQVVTRDRASCYAALGHLHAHLQPLPGRFRDYIALPATQPLPGPAHVGHRPQRPAHRGPDPLRVHGCDRRARHRGSVGGRRRRAGQEPVPALARAADGLAARRLRSPRVHRGGQGRPLRRRGLRVLAGGRHLHLPQGRHADRLRVRDPHGRGHEVLGRPGQRAPRAAALPPAPGRHRRDPDQPFGRTTRGVAQDVREQPGAGPDQALPAAA